MALIGYRMAGEDWTVFEPRLSRRRSLVAQILKEAWPTDAPARCRWLGREDSNLRMAAPKAAALPLGDSPLRRSGTVRLPRSSFIPAPSPLQSPPPSPPSPEGNRPSRR